MRGCSASTNQLTTNPPHTMRLPADPGLSHGAVDVICLPPRRIKLRKVTRQRATGGRSSAASGEVFHTAPAKGGKLRRGGAPADHGRELVRRGQRTSTAARCQRGPAGGRKGDEGSTGWSRGCRAAAETAGGATAGEGAEPGLKRPGQAD